MRRMYSKKQLEEIAKDYIHEHEDVIANPQVTGTEDLLRTIEIDGEKYILPENAEVTASEIDSEEATSGQVLMADGEGGASWGNIPNELPASLGTAGQVLKVNSSGTAVEWASIESASGFTITITSTIAPITLINSQGASVNATAGTYKNISFITYNTSAIDISISNGYITQISPSPSLPNDSFALLSDLTCSFGIHADPVLANNSWATIATVCESGQASNYWNVGDTKTDLGTDGNTRTFRIADMSGLYNKHVVFEQVKVYDTVKIWNPTSNKDNDNAYNDYAISRMVSTHLPAYELLLSSDLQATLTSTTVKVAKNGNSSTILDVSSKLFLPASKEVDTSGSSARTEENAILTTWQYYTTNTTASDRIKRDSTSTARKYWLRSPSYNSSGTVVAVDDDGRFVSSFAEGEIRIAPCFAL